MEIRSSSLTSKEIYNSLQGAAAQEFDSSLKNKQFSNSRIEEMSMNFGNMVISSNMLNQSASIAPGSIQSNISTSQNSQSSIQPLESNLSESTNNIRNNERQARVDITTNECRRYSKKL